jgi:hypothetical protein
MFEKEAEEYAIRLTYPKFQDNQIANMVLRNVEGAFQKGAEFGYKSAIEWFDAKESIPLPKKAEIYRYTLEAISDKGDIVCYDYKDKCWKKLIIEDEKVTYVSVEIKMWCNKPIKESE